MGVLKTLASTLAVVFLLRVIFLRVYSRLELAKISRSQNCAAPPRIPSRDPFLGIDTVLNNFRALKNNVRIKQVVSQHQKYGTTFESFAFGRRVISTIDPRNIQAVLSTQHERFGVGPIREGAVGPMLGKGIISSDGETWMHGRAMVKPTFTRGQIADPVVFEGFMKRFLEVVDGERGVVDLQPWFDKLILDASSEFIFGKSFDSLKADCPEDSHEFLDCLSYAQRGVGFRIVMGRMSFMLRDSRFWKSCTYIRNYTRKHVDLALAGSNDSKKATESEKEKYILVYEMAKESRDREELTSQLLNVFFAGRDTPAVALSNVFFCLARHPEVWKKVRDEIEGLTVADLTFERLKSLRYVQHVINEAMRLQPPVPNQSRSCLTQTILPSGGGPDGSKPLLVHASDSIAMNFYALHRNPEIYAPDPDVFRPERWPDLRPNWDYLPFGGGARHCPAQQLALFWVGYAIVRIAMEFKEVRNKDVVMEFRENLKLNLESRNGVKVELVRG